MLRRETRNIPEHVVLFCTLQGSKPLYPQQVRGMLKNVAEQAGLPEDLSPGILRNTFAAQLRDSGLPVSRISYLLGHGSRAATVRYLRGLGVDTLRLALAVGLPWDPSSNGTEFEMALELGLPLYEQIRSD
jgi:site-specific recombinase XerD